MADEEDEDGAAGPPTQPPPTTSHPPATVTWRSVGPQGGALLFGGEVTPFLTGLGGPILVWP